MKIKAHKHTYDADQRPGFETFVSCTQCGFMVPARMLASRSSLDAIVARKNATAAGLARIETCAKA